MSLCSYDKVGTAYQRIHITVSQLSNYNCSLVTQNNSFEPDTETSYCLKLSAEPNSEQNFSSAKLLIMVDCWLCFMSVACVQSYNTVFLITWNAVLYLQNPQDAPYMYLC